jgi:hypothetical protein
VSASPGVRPSAEAVAASTPARLVQHAGRALRAHPAKQDAEVHDHHDVDMPVLAAALNKRAPGYLSLGFPDSRKSM